MMQKLRQIPLRKQLAIFVVISILLHLLVVGVSHLPDYLHARREAARIAAVRLAAQQHALEQKKALEAARAAVTKAALAQTKQQVEAQLADQFKALVGNQLKPDVTDELWQDMLGELSGRLDQYSEALSDEKISDADMRDQLAQLQGQMLDDLLERLRKMSAQELANRFVSKIQNDVAPQVADYYRKQIEARIGNALRDEGSKIVRDEAGAVAAQRQDIGKVLENAESSARSAQADLIAVHGRQQSNLNNAGSSPDEAKSRQLADTARAEQKMIDNAGTALESVRRAVREAASRNDALSAEARQSIAEATVHGAGTPEQHAGEASKAAGAGDAKATEKSTAAAAEAAGAFADALHAARGAVARDNADPGDAARLAIKHARDDVIRDDLDRAFREEYARQALPRLSDKLTGIFKQTLEESGNHNEAVVAQVDKEVRDALGEKLHVKVAAGEAGTHPLTAAEHLNELKDEDSEEEEPVGEHHAHGPYSHHGHHHGGPHGDEEGSSDEGEGGGSGVAGEHGATTDRERAVASRLEGFAHGLTQGAMAGIGADGAADVAAVASAGGNQPHHDGHGEGEEGAGGAAALAARLGHLAGNVRSGRTDLAGATGVGSSGGVGLVRLRQSAYDSHHGYSLRDHNHINLAEYAALTAGLHDRDPAAVRGQATTRPAAPGEALAIAVPKPDEVLHPARLLIPSASRTVTDSAAPIAAPFKPAFKTIAFAAIPFRSKPITIDGDLSEWVDVPALPMHPAVQGAKRDDLRKFPQAVRALWDNTGFYAAYDVKDADGVVTKATAGNFWEADAVEIWFDTLNTKDKHRIESTYQFWAWVVGSAKDANQIGGETINYGSHDDFVPCHGDFIQTASKKTTDGWSIEVHIPVERFNRAGRIDLSPGRILGMNFSICTGTPLYYYWAGTADVETSRHPDTWGDVLLAGSAGKVECIDKLASEMKAGESATIARYIHVGDLLRLRVSDGDMNLSDKVKDKLAITVSTSRGQRQMVVLEETTESSGVFEGAIRTLLDTGESKPDVLSLFEGESIETTYIDQCRPDGARDVPVKLTVPTAAAIGGIAGK